MICQQSFGFGTATTFDLVGRCGSNEGGIIAPGVNLSAEALYLAAARLPRLAVEPWKADLSRKDTVSAMHLVSFGAMLVWLRA